MARTTKPLSDKEISSAKPREKEYKLFDGGGLYIAITPDGGKRWRLKYIIDGKEKRISLGTYPSTSLAKAREKREQLKVNIADCIDPSVMRKEVKQIKQVKEQERLNTFRHNSSDYFELIRAKISAGHFNKQWQRLETNIHPFIGEKLITEITREEILKCLTRIQERGAIEEAHRNYNIVNQVFEFAIGNKRCERNTAKDISVKWTLQPVVKRHFPTITNPKGIGKLLIAIDTYTGHYAVRCALQIAPYVFVRPLNLRMMEWKELDLDKAVWTIPSTKMKNKKEFIIPLVPKVVEILKELYGLNGGGPYCFSTGGSKTRPMSDNTLNAALIRMGYGRDEIVPHGFRAMFSTIANERSGEHGQTRDVIEKCLAHEESNRVRAAYNRAEYWEQRIVLMQWWADFLDELKVRKYDGNTLPHNRGEMR